MFRLLDFCTKSKTDCEFEKYILRTNANECSVKISFVLVNSKIIIDPQIARPDITYQLTGIFLSFSNAIRSAISKS